MTDDQFRSLCNTYGFAPSRALRELLDAATAQAVISEREACAKLAASKASVGDASNYPTYIAAAIRARDKKEPRQA
jgi:hypothetical protein